LRLRKRLRSILSGVIQGVPWCRRKGRSVNSRTARRPSTMVISTATVAKPTAPPVSSQLSAVSADNCELTPGWGGSGELRFDFGEKSVEESFEGVAVEADFLALGEAQHRALLGQPDPLRDRHHRAVLGHRR